MTVKLVMELNDNDLDYFRNVLDETWQRNSNRPEEEIIDEARRLLASARTPTAPDYVRKRLDDLDTLIAMLEDSEWPLEQNDRRRIIVALSYFAEPKDLIPDTIPGVGFLDDALMAELVIGELEHALDGYREFCEYRANEATLRGNTHVSRADWLAAQRRQIFLRIERRQRESRRHASTEGPTDPILRYQY